MTAVLNPPPVLADAEEPPDRAIIRLIGGSLVARTLYSICKLGVPDACADQPRSVVELAGMCGADADALMKYLRVVAAQGLMEESADGFRLTEVGRALRTDVAGSLAPFIVVHGELLEPSSSSVLYALRTGRPAFAHTHGAPFYEHLAGDPDHEHLFAEAMTARAVHLHAAVIDAIDWSGVRHLVDVGGNRGAFLVAILRRLPDATGVLFDQAQVVAQAEPTLVAGGVADRVDVEAGDFFRAVPPGGDLYLLANVLWNWSDVDARNILRRCRDVMSAAARLVICEPVVPPGNDPHPAKMLDLANFWLNGGRTRDVDAWRKLLGEAGFELVSVTETSLEWSVLDARPRSVV